MRIVHLAWRITNLWSVYFCRRELNWFAFNRASSRKNLKIAKVYKRVKSLPVESFRKKLEMANDSRVEASNLVPRVFSISNMAAAGEKTLAHSRNHVTVLATESGNLFKMAAKLKSERIWVQGLETWWKTNKMAAEANSKKLKIWMNALTSHRNTVEWYSDLIFCSMTWV